MKKLCWLTTCLALFSTMSHAAEPYVPDELKAWESWVLHGEEFRQCPGFFNRHGNADAFVCAFAEPLQLQVNARGGRFNLRVQTYTETWVALPGDTGNFPQEVTVNNRPVVVAERDNRPALRLDAGTHRIAGRFSWTRRPERLQVPVELALLTLNVDGKVIASPERRGQYLWLGERQQQAQQPESLELEVYRLLADGIPMTLETRVRLRVAGNAREVLLGKVLPEGFVPMRLGSALPARIEPDGRLRVQLRPGEHEVFIGARATAVRPEVVFDGPGEPWAASEIWSYSDAPRLRVTSARGNEPVDPQQVEVPGGWQTFPAFQMVPGSTLMIEERGRGASVQQTNRLSLNRELWLDFDGGGMTARDVLQGEMRVGWRLDMAEPYRLTSAGADGNDLLVTEGPAAGMTGVELRSPQLVLEASSRIGQPGQLPVSGWTESLASMQASLHLPPGYFLLAASGVDQAIGAWTSRWKLLDFFLLLVIAVAVRRLFGNLAGLVALLALVLGFHEQGAMAWSWLNLVVAVALAQAVTAGRLGQAAGAYRNLSVLLVLILLVPFVAQQVRVALFPQLESVAASYAGGPSVLPATAVPEEMALDAANTAKARRAQQPSRKIQESRAVPGAEDIVVTGSRIVSSAFSDRYDPNAQVQTGPGLANWQWRRIWLNWSGPVEPDQVMRLIILSPWQTALWRLLGALFSVALFVIIVLASFNVGDQLRRLREGTAPAAGVLLMLITPFPQEALAETPPQAVLDELRTRLIAAPDCMPQCAAIPSARVDVNATTLAIELDVHASERVVIPLPGQDSGWQADSFSLDGRRGVLLHRDNGGTLWLTLTPGTHRIRLTGPTPAASGFQVAFPLPPREVLASAAGWELGGIRDQRLVSGALQLTRVQPQAVTADERTTALSADRFPAFVRVTRVLTLGLDWQVMTRIDRLAPDAGAINLRIPLLDGESVLSEFVPVADGQASVNMGPGQRNLVWYGTLERADRLSLAAPSDAPWREVWRIEAGHSWHAEYEGTPLVLPEDFPGDYWVPEFYPRPGENLIVTLSRPTATQGETLAIDRLDYLQQAGERSSSLSLNLNYRSTRGAQHPIGLPPGAELENVTIDGRKQELRLDQGRLLLPVTPGAHTATVSFRLEQGTSFQQTLPAIDLNAPASNLHLGLDLPRDRWVLLTSGPTLGPAVLYWAELVVFLVLAWLLGKTRITPLRTRDWLLLGLGFSTFSWGVLGIVTAWLFAIGWRAQTPEFGRSLWFNVRQVLLAMVSVIVLLTLVSAIPMALLGDPDMHVSGNGSSMHRLRWFADRSLSELPAPLVYSVPLWAYKILILLWSLWLSFALVRWLPWVWQALRSGRAWAPQGDKSDADAAASP